MPHKEYQENYFCVSAIYLLMSRFLGHKNISKKNNLKEKQELTVMGKNKEYKTELIENLVNFANRKFFKK